MEIIIFLIIFVIFVLAGLLSVCLLILYLSKYSQLAKHYSIKPQPNVKLESVYARLNFVTFNQTLKLGLYPEGIYLSPAVFFRFKQPELILVPWVDAEIKNVDFYTGQPRIKIQIGPEKHNLYLYGEKQYAHLRGLMQYQS
jgi:hypothetical protein